MAADLSKWMNLGDTGPAIAAASHLDAALHKSRSIGTHFGIPRQAFLTLLCRRGYLVGTPEEVARSIREIYEIGPGFDLYSLSEALAACDLALVSCLGLAVERQLPELGIFDVRCRCGGRKAQGGAS